MRGKGESILEALRAARQRLGLSQGDLGQEVGMLQSQVSRVENGVVDPRLSTLTEIARALDLEPAMVPRPLVPVVRRLIEDTLNGESSQQRPLYRVSDESED